MVRVLILDDEPQMGELIALILEAEGYDCLVTDDTYEAWALLHTLPFDVLTQDTMRPDIDGAEFYHLVRADPSLTSLAIVMVTALPPGDNPDVASDPRLDAYLPKPFRRRELASAVGDALAARDKPPPARPRKASHITPTLLLERLTGKSRAADPSSALEGLRAGDREERRGAARTLGHLGDSLAVEPLLAALADPDPGVRWAAAMALGRLGAPRAAGFLAHLLTDDHELVRLMAAHALGKIGELGAETALVERLEDDSDWVRRAAMSALGEIRAPAAVPRLVAILHGPAELLRRAAGRALGHIGQPSVDALVAALGVAGPAVRFAAILGLARIEEDTAVDQALINALGDPDDRVREAAVHALGDRDPERVTGTLITALHDRNPDVAATAATVLAWIGEPGAIPALERVVREDTRITSRGDSVAAAARTAIRWINSNSSRHGGPSPDRPRRSS